MKKSLLITSLGAGAAFILRILQCFLITDTQGYFVCDGTFDTLLSHSVTAVILLCCVFALVLYAKGGKGKVCATESMSGGAFCGVLAFLMAAILLMLSGFSLGSMLESKKIDVAAALGFLAAFGFIFYALAVFSKKSTVLEKLFGFFPSAYFCACAIMMFFNSISVANRPDIRLRTVSYCVMALYMILVAGSRAGAQIAVGRARAGAVLCAVVCASSVPNVLFATALTDYLFCGELVIMTLFSFVSIYNSYKTEPLDKAAIVTETEAEPEPEQQADSDGYPDLKDFEDVEKLAGSDSYDTLEVYIDEVPDEKENNDEE